jgi:phospholipase D-like protein
VQVLAYDFPLLSLFLLSIWWFFLLTLFFGVIYAFIDNFRRRDHSGWAKAGWALFILVVPLLGTLIYLIARPVDVATPGIGPLAPA